jgi:MFS family permease
MAVVKENPNFIAPHTVVVGALMGFCVAVLILFYDYRLFDDKAIIFLKKSDTRIWLSLSVIMMTLEGAAIPLVAGFLRSFYREFNLNIKKVLAALLWCALFSPMVIIPLSFSLRCDYPFPHSGVKTTVIGLIAFIAPIMAAIGILFVNYALKSIDEPISLTKRKTDQVGIKHIQNHLRFREYLSRLLFIFGASLTLYTLILGAKSRAVSPYCEAPYEPKLVLLYGIFYSAWLVLGYLPTYTILLDSGHRISANLIPLSLPNDERWSDDFTKRKELEELLKLNRSFAENLLTVLALIAPIVSAVYSFIVEKKE